MKTPPPPDVVLKDTKHRECQPGEPCAVIPVPQHDCPPGCDCEPGAGYLRVSAIMKREELLSPELQAHDIEVFAKLRKIRLVKMVCDINKTGTEFTQRRVGEMIDDIKRRAYTQVVMLNWDRWGRDEPESQLYLRRVREAGGTVRAAAEDFDVETDVGELTVGQLLLIAQFRSRQISKGWKRVGAKRKRDGLPHRGIDYFGYTRTDGGYVINPEQAPVLRDAYERFLAGASQRSLAFEWNAKGIPTMKGNQWTQRTLARMMDTGFAAGWIRAKSKPGTAKKPGSKSLWAYDEWHPGVHEKIIDQGMWEAYLTKREVHRDMPPRLRVAAHALSGLLYCSLCLNDPDQPREVRMVSVYSGKHKKHSWVCPRARDAKVHRFASIANNLAMAAVLEWVNDQVGHQDVTEEARRLAAAQAAATSAAALETAKANLIKRRKKVTSLLVSETIDAEDGAEEIARIQSELASVETSLTAALAMQSGQGVDRVRAFTTLREEWDRFEPSDHREALSAVVKMIVVVPAEEKYGRATLRPIEVWES